MSDSARSDDPDVQRQFDRLASLSPGRDTLGLERITALCERLGNPQLAMPPALHVAGTNGKGSTCAFLRAMLEASGRRVHVYTSPHLVRFNERIRLAGELVDDARLADALGRVFAVSDDIGPSFFEATTAAAFLLFSETPADACVIEVGLGGRLDATNILQNPVSCGIAMLGIDHEAFLLAEEGGTPREPYSRIAWEKAGIAKSKCPLVTQKYTPDMNLAIIDVASRVRAPVYPRGEAWDAACYAGKLHYRDTHGKLVLPLPRLPGSHQADNAALAIAMLRYQSAWDMPEAAFKAGIEWADWPARLQLLGDGPLRELVPARSSLWLDGGHNPAAAHAVLDFLNARPAPAVLVLGMLANKDLDGFLSALKGLVLTVIGVGVAGHDHHAPEDIARAARAYGFQGAAASGIEDALRKAAFENAPTVLIGGSLYLAGEVLALNRQVPR